MTLLWIIGKNVYLEVYSGLTSSIVIVYSDKTIENMYCWIFYVVNIEKRKSTLDIDIRVHVAV